MEMFLHSFQTDHLCVCQATEIQSDQGKYSFCFYKKNLAEGSEGYVYKGKLSRSKLFLDVCDRNISVSVYGLVCNFCPAMSSYASTALHLPFLYFPPVWDSISLSTEWG
jgi:hypothetical protein